MAKRLPSNQQGTIDNVKIPLGTVNNCVYKINRVMTSPTIMEMPSQADTVCLTRKKKLQGFSNPRVQSHSYFFFESKHFIYSVRNVHSRETEQHYLNIVM